MARVERLAQTARKLTVDHHEGDYHETVVAHHQELLHAPRPLFSALAVMATPLERGSVHRLDTGRLAAPVENRLIRPVRWVPSE